MAIRKLTAEDTVEDLRAERIFTLARLEDEDLTELIPIPKSWDEGIEAVFRSELAIADEEARVSAAMTGANVALDAACTSFGEKLLDAVGGDREHARYRTFFKTTLTDFNRGEFAEQVKSVRKWLTSSTDPLIESERSALEKANGRSERALARDATLDVKRGERWQERQRLAARMTAERDALHERLAPLGRDRGMPRGWADTFFRKGRPTAKKVDKTTP